MSLHIATGAILAQKNCPNCFSETGQNDFISLSFEILSSNGRSKDNQEIEIISPFGTDERVVIIAAIRFTFSGKIIP